MKSYRHIIYLWFIFLAFALGIDSIGVWEMLGAPKPEGWIFQGTLFLGFYALMKVFLFDPMIQVQSIRSDETEGKALRAQDDKKKSDALLAKYEAEIAKAKLRALARREKTALEAEAEEKETIAKAREAAQKQIEHQQESLLKDMAKVQSELKGELVELVDLLKQQLSFSAGNNSGQTHEGRRAPRAVHS